MSELNRFEKSFDWRKAVLSVEKEGDPLIVMIAFEKMDDILLEECRKKQTKQFNLLTVSNLHWDEELSPWPHAPVVMKDDHFTGEAPKFLSVLDSQIIPWALSNLKEAPSDLIIGGYSMGGLFALYALYESKLYSKALCVSGSLWFPGFLDWAKARHFKGDVKSVYFSLGNLEVRTPNKALQTTADVMQSLAAIYEKEGIDAIFEWNQGNHFVDAIFRIAKGIRWILKHPED